MKSTSIIFRMMLSSLLLLGIQSAWSQTKSRVIITAGGNEMMQREVGKALTAVLQESNYIAEGKGDLQNVREFFTADGYTAMQELVQNTGLFSTIPEYRLHLLQTSDNTYQVRGIRVRVKMGDTKGDDIQEAVFIFNVRLFIDNVQFAMEKHHYQRLIEEGEKLDDMIFRHQALSFLENFRTAHNRKDLDFLEKTYSDNALIIVGHVLEEKQGESDFLESSLLARNKIEFIKLSKQQYIERLRQVFNLNSFVRVTFDDVEILRHSKYPEIYGLKLRQRWNSSNYSDEGYLFIMMDFENPDQPLIHVRAWQPEPFEDGTVVGLGDFRIID